MICYEWLLSLRKLILLKKKKLILFKKKKKIFNQNPAILYAVIYVSFGTEFAGLMFGRID